MECADIFILRLAWRFCGVTRAYWGCAFIWRVGGKKAKKWAKLAVYDLYFWAYYFY